MDGHQVGVIVPVAELLAAGRKNGRYCKCRVYSRWLKSGSRLQQLIDAGQALPDQGADVIMLDCLGFHQRHRDILQQALDAGFYSLMLLIARLAFQNCQFIFTRQYERQTSILR